MERFPEQLRGLMNTPIVFASVQSLCGAIYLLQHQRLSDLTLDQQRNRESKVKAENLMRGVSQAVPHAQVPTQVCIQVQV